MAEGTIGSLPRRAFLLALLLSAAGLILLHPSVVVLLGARRLGPIVLFGLPMLAAILSLLLIPHRRESHRRVSAWQDRVVLVLACIFAFACDQGFVGFGHLLGWLTFTYGEQSLVSHPLTTAAWALPACLLLGVFGWERALRGGVLAGAREQWGARGAMALSMTAGTLLSLPGILLGPSFGDPPYVAAAILTALCREAVSCVIFLSGGGILLAGLYRGFLAYFEGFVLTDLNALMFPMANYTGSEPRLYLLRGAAALAALAVVAAGAAWVKKDRAAA